MNCVVVVVQSTAQIMLHHILLLRQSVYRRILEVHLFPHSYSTSWRGDNVLGAIAIVVQPHVPAENVPSVALGQSCTRTDTHRKVL